MTASAAAEIRAGRLDSLRGGLENAQGSSMDHAFGGADFLHLRALPRQDTRNQNGAAPVVAQGLAAVNQLGRSKFEGRIANRNWKIETRELKLDTGKSKLENRTRDEIRISALCAIHFDSQFRIASSQFPTHI